MSDADAQAALARMAAQISDLEAQLQKSEKDKTDAVAEAEQKTIALQAKYDSKFGTPVPSENITQSSVYITADGRSHPNLEEARIHDLALQLGISVPAARNLAENSKSVVPLIQRAAT